jgi:beta-N-acetylhexosaminidase
MLQIALTFAAIAALVFVGVFWFVHRGSGTAAAPKTSTTPPASPAAPVPPVCDDDVAQMKTSEKLAQLLMVGVKNGDDARKVVADYHVGGIFVGSWTDLSMLQDGTLNDINAGLPLPLAVSVDEEGGRVDRLKRLIGPSPSARQLAATKSPDEVYQLALQRGREMKSYGITIDFAPVVDVSDEPDDEVIGDRSFGNDPQQVTTYAGAFARGLRDAGILPVLKHFPGHGHGSGDTHLGSVTTPPLDALKQDDLIPYRTLVTERPVAVMVGHLLVPGLPGDLPTSLNPAAYALLRSGEYGGPPFDGLVFTDDLSSMHAISDEWTVPEAVVKSLQAGADVALWVSTDEVPAVLKRLQKAVDANELSMADIDKKLHRIAATKGRSPRCHPG